MSIFVSPIGSGFGDVIISLPVIQTLLESGEQVFLVTRSFRQQGIAERVAGLAGELSESELAQRGLEESDRYINLRDHPLQRNHVWGSAEFEKFFGPTNMERIISQIASDFGIETNFRDLQKLQHKRLSELCGKVALIPGTDGFYKHWPVEFWLETYASLLRAGIEGIVLGIASESPPVKRLIEAALPAYETKTAADAIDAISNCAAVISVDTGLMHVAVQQNVPTFAFIHPRNYHQRSAANCFNFVANDCSNKCNRDFNIKPGFAAASELAVELKFDHRECNLDISENCMASIKPKEVISQVLSILR